MIGYDNNIFGGAKIVTVRPLFNKMAVAAVIMKSQINDSLFVLQISMIASALIVLAMVTVVTVLMVTSVFVSMASLE